MIAVAKKLDEVEAGSRRLYGVREDSREECVRVIRRLESQLATNFEHTPLRGLPVVLQGRVRVYGMRVRGQHDEQLPHPSRDGLAGPWTIVLTPKGQLVQARRVRVGNFADAWVAEQKPVSDDDLIAQDLHAVMETVLLALDRHLAGLSRTTQSYETLRLLAFGMGELLERLFPAE